MNWTRLVHFRVAFAQFFDHPSSHHHFREIESGTIVYGKNFRSTAILFIGWLAAQLDWQIRKGRSENGIELQNSARRPVQIELQEDADAPIGSFIAHSSDIKFEIALARCGDLLEVSRAKSNQVPARQLLPAGENDSVRLMSEELMRGGQRRVYLRAVEKVRDLL